MIDARKVLLTAQANIVQAEAALAAVPAYFRPQVEAVIKPMIEANRAQSVVLGALVDSVDGILQRYAHE